MFLAAAICLYCGRSQPETKPAELVLLNGNIITLDDGAPRAEALAASGGRILVLGDSDMVRGHIGESTRVIDLEGATAVPGFIEGHGHLKNLGVTKMNVGLMDAANWDEVIDRVAAAAAAAPVGEWIVGHGWHQEKWDPAPTPNVEGYPAHEKLSAATPDHPVVLSHASGHAVLANAKAMSLAGIDADTPDPEGGKLVRDASGNPIGVFEENAESLVWAAKQKGESEQTQEQRETYNEKAIKLAMAECLAKGITSFQDAGSSFADIDLYKKLADAGELDIRLWVMAGSDNATLKERLPQYRIKGYADHRLTLGGIKRYADGALGSRGAWLLEPYEDLPESTGQNVMPLPYLREAAEIAQAHGLQLCVHAIGDRGNREVLNLYESVLQGEDRRWRIEHAQHLHPEDVQRMADLKVIASMQGVHCTSDSPFVVKRLGEERARQGAYVWRSLLDAGAVVTNGTDAPVEDVSPLANFYATVTRKRPDGASFFPEQRLTPEEALRGYTLHNAYAAYEDDIKGSLSPGKLADITVLSADITAADPEQIPRTEVLYTIVGGEVKYQKSQ